MTPTDRIRTDSPASWPTRLQDLVRKLRTGDQAASEDVPGEVWQILFTALSGYVRYHTSRLGPLPEVERDDITAQKSLDLLALVDSHKWNPETANEGQVRAFVSTVARNGVVDALRNSGRTLRFTETDEWSMTNEKMHRSSPTTDASSSAVEAREFVESLYACVERLQPRSRRLWFFRVIYELSSKRIAAHPDVRMTVGHVDVALQRCRMAISECMMAKGLKVTALPAGTFATLWELCLRKGNSLEDHLLQEEGHG